MIKVLLADDTEMLRRIIRRIMSMDVQIDVLGEAGNFAETIELACRLHPDIVVLDLHMPDGEYFSPADVKAGLLKSGARIIAMSIFQDEEAKLASKILGAPLLDKMNLASELVPAILREMNLRSFAAKAS
jgi:DNA-binding NarL/FixJ family response regulator